MADKDDSLKTIFGTLFTTNYVASAFKKEAEADSAIQDLTQAGFADAHKFSPQDLLAQNEKLTSGGLSGLAQALSDEKRATDEYVRLAEQGHVTVLVGTSDEDTVQRAAAILKSHGAVALRHYGDNTFKEM